MSGAIVDLPYGYRDDPEGLAGLAALAARWLASPAGGAPPKELGWHTRHRLEARVSSFSYWTALSDLDRVTGDFRGPDSAQLDGLREAQSRLLRRRSGDLYLRMLDAIDTAASGIVHCGPLGDGESMARVSADDVTGYLDRCRETGVTVYRTGDERVRPPVRRFEGAAPWAGGLVATPMPGENLARVAVRVPLRADALPDGALPLLVELLGTGARGRLISLLRGSRGLAYGVAALSWDGEETGPSVGGYALVDPRHVAEAATLLLDTLRGSLSVPPSGELSDAAVRCRTLLLVQADEPFGAVGDRRRRARGEMPLDLLAEAVAERALDGLASRVPDAAPPAIAVVGALREDQLSRLETLK
ncbi:hypothetical protein GCM10027598_01680 [Amycolatopsis oliviviridis]|uniref:Peptidase M16 C-terminal domain-containing protein n=1 Tax=Amycolatopsis oliviviridis TaxID=1471590 RepID=A0ABQ3LQH5_9PSEU|nr:insulinase family protein [Amycolatopsis oliviviridis]GHH22445.1 hypothetical protein GCM10017790_44200 [Amycolatopsis oliviviridis]